MKPAHLTANFDRLQWPGLSDIELQLLDIYWCKKDLDEYLPQIASYATPIEIAAVTLSQLAIIEKQLLEVLQQIAAKNTH